MTVPTAKVDIIHHLRHRRTVLAAHNDFVDQLAVGNVKSSIEEGLFFLFPVKIKHSPQQLIEQVGVRSTTLDT